MNRDFWSEEKKSLQYLFVKTFKFFVPMQGTLMKKSQSGHVLC